LCSCFASGLLVSDRTKFLFIRSYFQLKSHGKKNVTRLGLNSKYKFQKNTGCVKRGFSDHITLPIYENIKKKYTFENIYLLFTLINKMCNLQQQSLYCEYSYVNFPRFSKYLSRIRRMRTIPRNE
jgi:hypothetical protein